jgi:2-dehydropantoate 2-reductase
VVHILYLEECIDREERSMVKEMAVLGTGAIGSSIGADLSRAGYDVLLIDQWPAHIEAMKARGLQVIMPEEEVQPSVRAAHLCEIASLKKEFDAVFLTAKSYDTEWLVHFIKPYLNPSGVIVSVQNSLNDEWIAPIVGYERDIASVIELSAEVFEPGVVRRNTDRSRTWFAVGELHGRVTPRVQEIAGILGAAGRTEVTTNIWGAKWTKLAVNSMSQGIAGILGIYDWEIAENPGLLELSMGIGRECFEVGSALGYRLEPIFGMRPEEFRAATDEVLKGTLKTLISHIGKTSRNSTLQDHLKGRRSEVDFMNGLIVKKGREAGIPTPLNQGIASMTQQIEKGMLSPSQGNLRLLDKLLETTSEG